MSKPASKAQTFAIFCALQVDVRNCGLTYDKASALLQNANSPAKLLAREEAESLPGAVVKPFKVKAAKAVAIHAPKASQSFDLLWANAVRAGIQAGIAALPVPMVVQGRANPLDDRSPVLQEWHVSEGACGFAWVTFPGNTAFGKWAKAKGVAKPAYRGGLQYWIADHNQSITRKEAHAAAMARVLSEAGIERVYSDSRMD